MKPRYQDMHPELQVKYLAFAGKMAERGLPFGLSCVLRLEIEQQALYAQGREPVEAVNARRMLAGMTWLVDIMSRTEPGVIVKSAEAQNVIVTHTKISRHFPDKNGKSRAFDIQVLGNGGRPTWDLKFDGDQDGIGDYMEAAEIGKSCGLDCGAFWPGFRDYPHMQLPDKV